jgi:excisionase family DNA binding protein
VKASTLIPRLEAAATLGVGLRTLDRLLADGEITCVRIGRRVLFDPEDLHAFIARSKEVA